MRRLKPGKRSMFSFRFRHQHGGMQAEAGGGREGREGSSMPFILRRIFFTATFHVAFSIYPSGAEEELLRFTRAKQVFYFLFKKLALLFAFGLQVCII